MAESITITDNRTGELLEIPFENGGIAAEDWSKLLLGRGPTTSGSSPPPPVTGAITYLDGEAGILRYRGYPIEQLAEELQLLGGAHAAVRTASSRWQSSTTPAAPHHPLHLHPRERTEALPRRVPLRRPPHGHAGLRGGCPLYLLPRCQGHFRHRVAEQADRPAHRQDADPGRRRPPLQRGHALRLSRTTRSTSPPTSSR